MMKNLFFAATIAALTCAGCATEDEGVTPVDTGKYAINFSTEITRSAPVTAFADNDVIGVFGTETLVATPEVPTTDWMKNIQLTRTSGSWGYTDTKFFVTGYKYSFAAYAPYDATVTDPTSISYTASTTLSEQKDLMYAEVIEKDFSTVAPTASTASVALNFHHALAQLKFSAKTAADYSAYYDVKVTKVQVVDVMSKAVLNAKTGEWGTPDTKATYEQKVANTVLNEKDYTALETEGDDVLMLIPQTLPADCKVVMTVVATNKSDNTITKTTDIDVAFPANDAWTKNSTYRYKVSLNLNSILGFENAVFSDPTIVPWDGETDKEM